MKNIPIIALAAAAALACNEAPMSSDELGRAEEALCANGDGVPAAMAALAVATAKELRRWQPLKDFYINNGSLALTSTGKSLCADGRCWNTQGILDLQRAPLNSVKLAGVTFNADNFRSQLYSNFNEQKICESRPDNHAGDNCPAEQHKLTLKSVSSGSCDTVFTFNATTPTGGLLSYPAQLKNKLIYAGYPENSFLSFTSTGSTVSIDPTYGLNDTGTTSSGSCAAACTKLSALDVAGQCCSCSGSTRRYQRSAFSAAVFLCM
jgi:hypothetical protein